ncbi:ImmA/IrrE family metallo-endopeptidase [Virgibacillus sp. DJP39]|uniref:ImmA/IrrE family metallo-endopeptidase n=1 Tax=Virgibacillus sp. DJP39 TaxID=3409790 RepID=UPI003BB67D84
MVAYITPEKMESITVKILTDYEDVNIGVDNPTLPIPIEEIIEFHFDLSILWENINYLNPSETVMAAIFPNKKVIVMNESQRGLFEEKIGTMNFTFAHELGHWVLHATDDSQLCFDMTGKNKVFYCRSVSNKPPEEIQADMFASSLLMPKTLIISSIKKLKKNGTVQWTDLYELKDKFDVSITALTTRLQYLNLLYIDKNKVIHNSKEEASGQMALDL